MEKTDNEIIAEFMGLFIYQTRDEMLLVPVDELKMWAYPGQLQYHEKWDELMPVIEKICELWHENIDQYNNPPKDQREADQRFSKVGMLSIDCGIKAAYINVVEFIKWYNEQNR